MSHSQRSRKKTLYTKMLCAMTFSTRFSNAPLTKVGTRPQYTLPLLVCGLLLSACGPQQEQSSPQAAQQPNYVLDFDHHDLMTYILDPAADVIWSSAGEIITIEGTQDLAPTTDEGWLNVQNSAATLIESANLLQLPGRAEDLQDWAEYSQGLATMSRKAFVAAEAKDAEALFAAGADLYQVCLACHQKYAREES